MVLPLFPLVYMLDHPVLVSFTDTPPLIVVMLDREIAVQTLSIRISSERVRRI